jgi:hypothetical protein
MANAFCRVAPSVRFRDLAIFFAGVFFRASDLRSRTCSVVQARLFFDPFLIAYLFSSYKGLLLVALSWSKEKPRHVRLLSYSKSVHLWENP